MARNVTPNGATATKPAAGSVTAFATLDRTSPLPLWAQLEAELRRRLDAGEFDDRFPTDIDLVDTYAVSRNTVREAIRSLNKQGVLHRQRGRGTVIVKREFDQPLGVLYSLFRTIEARGVEQQSIVTSLKRVVEADAAGAIGLPEETELLCLERIRCAGGLPLAFDQAWLPYSIAKKLEVVDFSHTSLYDELAARCGVTPTRGWENITSVAPDRRLREHLQLTHRQPLLRLERGSFDGDQPVEYRLTYIRGENFRLVSEWSNERPATINAEQIETNPNAPRRRGLQSRREPSSDDTAPADGTFG